MRTPRGRVGRGGGGFMKSEIYNKITRNMSMVYVTICSIASIRELVSIHASIACTIRPALLLPAVVSCWGRRRRAVSSSGVSAEDPTEATKCYKRVVRPCETISGVGDKDQNKLAQVWSELTVTTKRNI